MKLHNFDSFLNEGLVSTAEEKYPAAVDFFKHDMGDSWVKNHCDGKTAEEMVVSIMLNHFATNDAGTYNNILNDRKSSAKDKHLAISEALDMYNEMEPPIFSKEQWAAIEDAKNKEIMNYLQ
jgi:hypothetical protein